MDKEVNMYVAVKKTKLIASEETVQSELLLRCNSPFTVRYNAMICDKDELWVVIVLKELTNQIVTEFCHCRSLDAFIRSGNYLSEEELREIASSCLCGLYYLHQHSVIHGVSD